MPKHKYASSSFALFSQTLLGFECKKFTHFGPFEVMVNLHLESQPPLPSGPVNIIHVYVLIIIYLDYCVI